MILQAAERVLAAAPGSMAEADAMLDFRRISTARWSRSKKKPVPLYWALGRGLTNDPHLALRAWEKRVRPSRRHPEKKGYR